MRSGVQIGDKIHIIEMIGEPEYANTEGVVKYIWGSMILGTWGNKPLVYTDNFVIINQREKIKKEQI